MHSFKLHTARRIDGLRCCTGGIWQPRFYERALKSEKAIEEVAAYIHNNPVRSGAVSNPGEYRWSSYRAYTHGDPDPMEIDAFEF